MDWLQKRKKAFLIHHLFEDCLEDVIASECEQNMQQLRVKAIEQATEKHPVIFDRYNLCDINNKGKLKSKFSINMLIKICEHFELDTEGCSTTRKADIIIII